jgi:anti-sigma regulatory factor (Ser/Thr protein kinase)
VCPATKMGVKEGDGGAVSIGEGYDEVQSTRRVRRLRLPATAPAVKVARDEVAAALRAEGWPVHAVDRARVVASELATNAVLHTGAGFEVALHLDGGARIEVTDVEPDRLPRHADRADERPGGMGLYLVEALATAWGVERREGGKVVWAVLEPDPR